MKLTASWQTTRGGDIADLLGRFAILQAQALFSHRFLMTAKA